MKSYAADREIDRLIERKEEERHWNRALQRYHYYGCNTISISKKIKKGDLKYNGNLNCHLMTHIYIYICMYMYISL